MLTKLWRALRQQDRVEELEARAYSWREIPDRSSHGCVVKDCVQIMPWRERWAVEVDLHERAKDRIDELERELRWLLDNIQGGQISKGEDQDDFSRYGRDPRYELSIGVKPVLRIRAILDEEES